MCRLVLLVIYRDDDVQEYVRKRHPDADGVLPYILYSDETHINPAGQKIYPLVVFLALPLHIVRQAGLHRYLAYLPTFTGADVGLGKKRQKPQ